ncbi:MAG: hypothetical protein A4S14_12905 [Proteobacteria bacterium SG_bin9]|nr:MAG: hypothetical protein A4S14_12905 [Proteobacteria bacterium SG_bin9]
MSRTGVARLLGFNLIVSAIAALIRRREERKAVAELNAFSDKALRDMGIDRCGIERAVRLPAGYSPGCLWRGHTLWRRHV